MKLILAVIVLLLSSLSMAQSVDTLRPTTQSGHFGTSGCLYACDNDLNTSLSWDFNPGDDFTQTINGFPANIGGHTYTSLTLKYKCEIWLNSTGVGVVTANWTGGSPTAVDLTCDGVLRSYTIPSGATASSVGVGHHGSASQFDPDASAQIVEYELYIEGTYTVASSSKTKSKSQWF